MKKLTKEFQLVTVKKINLVNITK